MKKPASTILRSYHLTILLNTVRWYKVVLLVFSTKKQPKFQKKTCRWSDQFKTYCKTSSRPKASSHNSLACWATFCAASKVSFLRFAELRWLEKNAYSPILFVFVSNRFDISFLVLKRTWEAGCMQLLSSAFLQAMTAGEQLAEQLVDAISPYEDWHGQGGNAEPHWKGIKILVTNDVRWW